ncbi:MAG: hypothetical protein IJG87_06480 [Ruminococcus sp.]|nr:hypothetical protein [Ruminococcus sp.]
MLTELCQELHNWFDRERHTGTFTIENGNITADFLQDGQYFRVMGSVFSDGVHQYPAADLPSEEFEGAVWALSIPKPVINLAAEIAEWRAKYEAVDSSAMSPFNSESFGGYSYSKSGAGSSQGSGVSWITAFASRLNMWRKL